MESSMQVLLRLITVILLVSAAAFVAIGRGLHGRQCQAFIEEIESVKHEDNFAIPVNLKFQASNSSGNGTAWIDNIAHLDISKWSSIALLGDHYETIAGQWYVFISSIVFAGVTMVVCFGTCPGETFSIRRLEEVVLFLGMTVILAAAALETFFVAGWYHMFKCYCITWTVACAYLWLSIIMMALDAFYMYKHKLKDIRVHQTQWRHLALKNQVRNTLTEELEDL